MTTDVTFFSYKTIFIINVLDNVNPGAMQTPDVDVCQTVRFCIP